MRSKLISDHGESDSRGGRLNAAQHARVVLPPVQQFSEGENADEVFLKQYRQYRQYRQCRHTGMDFEEALSQSSTFQEKD
jgi:hypothetical protein